jgi:hypothetical protein
MWNMSPAANGQDVILTLCTPQGMVISFTIKSWQAEGMTTVATRAFTRESMKPIRTLTHVSVRQTIY